MSEMEENEKMSRTKKQLIVFLLESDKQCDLNDLAPIDVEKKDNRSMLCELRKKFVKNGDLAAVIRLSDYLKMNISAEELKTIINSAWKKHDVDAALEAIKLLLALSPFVGRDSIESALQICLHRAKTADLFYRQRYIEAIPIIMDLTTS